MIIISIIAGLLSTMNIWAVNIDHVRLHINDIYMILLMTSWMILLMNIYYFDHIKNANINIIIGLVSIVLIIYCIRTQVLIDDTQFLNGMIPHHSMAIQMAKQIKYKTTNENIKELANNIIDTQNKEIQLMDNILKTINK